MIGLACIFAALWIFLTMRENQLNNVDKVSDKEYFESLDNKDITYDAWGRQIDD
mgnify:FL=1